MHRRALRTLILLTVGVLVAGCSEAGQPPPPAADGLAAQLKEFQEGYFQRQPPFAVSQGRHEFDGKLPDWSADGLKATAAWLHEQRTKAEAFKPETLNDQQRFEQRYLTSVIDGDLFWLENAQQPFTNPGYYLDGGLDPNTYLSRPYASPDVRLKAFVKYAQAVPKAAEQIRANLRMPMPKSFIKYGADGFGGLADFYRSDVPQAFASVTDPELKSQLSASIEPAAQAMRGLADWLNSNLATGTEDFALGPQRFADMIRMTEGVTTSLAELEQVGRADLARNSDALKQACAQYKPGLPIEQCLAAMAADKPTVGVVDEARNQLATLRQFVVDKDLVSIPGTEQAQVAEAPAYMRSNSAYIDIPGPFDKGMPSIYYIAPPDPTWPKEEQDAYIPGKNDLLFTSAHEVWPGHFLQFLHANRSPFEFGQLFVGYAYAEGWAHYTEEMVWDAGLGNGSPETHIGQLTQALLRDVRFLCAIGMHTQGMTQATCEQMFREQAYQDPGNARQQAARGTYDPAYLNYTMGKLMIRKLRDDWVATRGGRTAWKEFHDKFLSYGGPPIPLVREQMLGPSAPSALF
ncbi:DUF885 domain-containing protein [Pseudonocardia spinosispora]|uniref:DUF885 domain-containing protein n=1 Tax=Pseudonocardia spinosispora TaxID=103441 RepID=UPI00048AFD71|nr:DUF885 domain-containing protein [Pseudonocardia spinosispora]